jgi:hypothetical protein
MRVRARGWSLTVVAFVLFAACGGGGDESEATDEGVRSQAGPVEARVSGEPLGAVDATGTTCRFDATASSWRRGSFRNAGGPGHRVRAVHAVELGV